MDCWPWGQRLQHRPRERDAHNIKHTQNIIYTVTTHKSIIQKTGDCHCDDDDETRAHYPHEPYYFYLLIISNDPHLEAAARTRVCVENHNDNDDVYTSNILQYIIIIIYYYYTWTAADRDVACVRVQSALGVTFGRWE